MTLFNVHIYREMKLRFDGIEAELLEAAANIARDKLTEDADDIEPCDGETFSALVDVVGDEDFTRSRLIEFDKPGKPIVVITVRGGLVVDVHSTEPTTIYVEDWDCYPDKSFIFDFKPDSLTSEHQLRIGQHLVQPTIPRGE